MRFLRDDPRCLFWIIIDVTAVDWPGRERRFDVVYHLLSPKHNFRVRLKVETDETTPVPSIIEVFPGADWFEREAYDLYGVVFTGHPDMRRLLTDYGFEGHPLRKDFPLTGFVEVRYDDELKRVVYVAGAAGAGVPQLRFPVAVGRHRLPAAGRRKGGQNRRRARVVTGSDGDETDAQARAHAPLRLYGAGEQDRSLHLSGGAAKSRRCRRFSPPAS